MPATQFNMKWVEPAGLVKFDFLGLKTLTVISLAEQLIRARGDEIAIENIVLDDKKTFDMLGRGETVGVFQLESSGMRDVLKKMRADRIEDIIAIGALYRPGPMQFIDDYIERKKGLKKVEYLHPLLEKVCSETHGIIVYQEQVQLAASVLAGYSLGEADLLRRAMGKKDAEKMAKERQRFVDGCGTKNQIPPKVADAIFGFIEKFHAMLWVDVAFFFGSHDQA